MKFGRVVAMLGCSLWAAGCGGGGERRPDTPRPSTANVADHGEAIRISYLHISRKAHWQNQPKGTVEPTDRFLVFTSKGWMQRHGPMNPEPYAAAFSAKRADYVADETMDKVVQGLTQAGLFTLPAIDPQSIDPTLFTQKSFCGTLVTVQRGNVRKTVAVRDPLTGALGGDKKAVLKIDAIMNAFANYADAAEFRTQVWAVQPQFEGWDPSRAGQRVPSGSR